MTGVQDNAGTQHEFMAIKHRNKMKLSYFVEKELGIVVDPTMMFDVQVALAYGLQTGLGDAHNSCCLQDVKYFVSVCEAHETPR